jgi:hypothetical protein
LPVPFATALNQTVELRDWTQSNKKLWPPSAASVAAAFTALASPAAAWWRSGDLRSEQLRREAAEVEAYYTRQHEAAEARENLEAKAAAQRR